MAAHVPFSCRGGEGVGGLWKQKCRKEWWQQEFAVFKCEAMAKFPLLG